MPKSFISMALATAAAIVALAAGAASAPAQPETPATESSPQIVLDWNETAVATVLAGGKTADAPLYVGLAQAAAYDAVVAIEGGFEPYLIVPGVPPGSSPEAAAAAASHGVLVSYFPAQKPMLDAAFAESLAAVPDGPGESAACWLASRSRRASWRRGSMSAETRLFRSIRRRRPVSGGRRRPSSCQPSRHGWRPRSRFCSRARRSSGRTATRSRQPPVCA